MHYHVHMYLAICEMQAVNFIDTSFTNSSVSQRERKAMKDKCTQHGMVATVTYVVVCQLLVGLMTG